MKKNTKILIGVIVVIMAVIPIILMGLMFFGIKKIDKGSGCHGAITTILNPTYEKTIPLSNHSYKDSFFGDDNDKIYAVGSKQRYAKACELIEHVDIDTFQVLNKFYAKDDNNIYIIYTGLDQRVIHNVDIETFTILDDVEGLYAKDESNVYFRANILEGADSNTFTPLKSKFGIFEYAKDKNNIYRDGKIMQNADVDTFVLVDCVEKKDTHICAQKYDAEDKYNKYKYGKKIN